MRYLPLIALVVVAVTVCACGQKHSRKNVSESADSLSVAEPQWHKVNPLELEMKPIAAFAEDWMALAVGNKRSMNSMTIAWGGIGQLWNKHVVTVYVSSDRYSKKMLDDNQYFTVTAFPQTKECREALSYIGTHSKRDETDKTAAAGLTTIFTSLGNPYFEEGCLTIECKKIYAEEFDINKVPQDIRTNMYEHMGMHTMYIGEIVNVWKKE